MTANELRALLDSIVKGVTREVADLSLGEFVDLYDQLLKRVDQARTDVTLVLADGQAWVSFPKLSRQIIKVSESRPLSRVDLRLTSPGKVTVIGGNHRAFFDFLGDDLRQAWLVPVGVLAFIAAAAQFTDIGLLAVSVATLLALAASIFFAVFVLFGVGEVVRAGSLQAEMFRSGQLQRYLDADRYLVRLAVISFSLSVLAVVAEPVRVGFLDTVAVGGAAANQPAPEWATTISFAVLAGLLWASATSTLLCLRAASGYLLDRAAGALLLGLGEDAIKSAHDPEGDVASGDESPTTATSSPASR